MTAQVSWIFMEGSTESTPPGFQCCRCGLFQPLALPMDTSTFIVFSNAFIKEHMRCREAEDGGVE